MAKLAGLTGLYQSLDGQPDGSADDGALEARANPVNPAHAKTGDTAGQTWPAGYGVGYQGQGTYYDSSGVFGDYDYPGVSYADPGDPIDETMSTHKGRYPRSHATAFSTVTPDDYAFVGEMVRELHGLDEGGVRVNVAVAPGGRENPTNYTSDLYEAPNDTVLSSNVPGQLRGSTGVGGGGGHLGSADPTQGYGELNSVHEFQVGRSHRRVQHDAVPFDYTLSSGMSGPWLGKHPSGVEIQFDGIDSPYGVMGNNVGLQRAGTATTLSYPTAYANPPSPTVAPMTLPSPDVWAY